MHSTARRLERVPMPLNLVCITIFREAHLLDVNEWDPTTYDAIDVSSWWIPNARTYAGSGSSHRWAVSSVRSLPHWWFRQWPTPRYTNHAYEFVYGSAEDMTAVQTFPFVPLFPSHLFFGSRPSRNGISMGFYSVPMEAEFPYSPDTPIRRHWAVTIGCGIYCFVRFCT